MDEGVLDEGKTAAGVVGVGTGHPPGHSNRTSISAHAAVRIEPAADGIGIRGGGVRVRELRSEVPLVLRRTGVRMESDDGLPTVTVHLVGAAAGPLAGDRLRLDITVGAGVRLVLRSTAATVALPGHGGEPSLFDVHADVGPGGVLEYLPEPTVAARGCRHRMRATIRLAADAHLLWREEIVLGRFGEPSGSVLSALRVDVRGDAEDDVKSNANSDVKDIRDGIGTDRTVRPLLRQTLHLDPSTPGIDGPAILGDARTVGSLLIAGPGPDGLGLPAGSAGTDTFTVLPLAGPGVLVSALAPDTVTLRRFLNAGAAAVFPPKQTTRPAPADR